MEQPVSKDLEAESAKGLYKSCLDIIDSMLSKTSEPRHADFFAEMMRDFCAKQLVARVYPKEKGWDPRHEWKSGEHSGFVVQMRNEKGQVLFINIYGGLRAMTRRDDLRDSDKMNTRIHNFRTEDVLSNATNVFFRLIDNSGDMQTEVKFFREPDRSFYMRSFKIKTKEGLNERSYKYRDAVFNHSDYHFDQVSQGFAEQCNYFTSTVESYLKN